ncbi:MAG: hypothetical protein DRI61_06910 [Chloroflexi bacterium]|nr:MAG: hypothetical protein DRI61_06910 [Chloroflexota bacterium]
MIKFTLISKNFLGRPREFEGMGETSIIGGAELNLYRTAKLLLEEGYEVNVLQEDNGIGISNYEGIYIKYIPTPDIDNPLIRTIFFNYRWRQYVPKGSYVHIHHEGYAVPFYQGIHSVNQQGIAWDYPGKRKLSTRFKLYITKKLLAQGAYIRASDNSFLSYVQSEWADYRNQVFPIPNGVDTERFCPQKIDPEKLAINADGRIIILFPRTQTIYRGAYIFLESLNILKKEYDNFVVLFIGALKTEIKEKIQDLIGKYKLKNNVIFIGHIPNEKMPEYYNIADIVTIPTYHSEGSSISCIEAMACGKPVVVTDVGGLKELIYRDEIDGGIKVKPTPRALASALKKLIQNPSLRDKLGKNARARVLKYYRSEQWKESMREYFKMVIENSKIPRWKES